MTLRKLSLTVILLSLIALPAGCTKLTFSRWRTLTLHSTKAEVETVLGDKHVAWKKADRWMYHDGDRQVTVNLEFGDADRVTYSRWLDPDNGMHEIGQAAIEDSDLIERETGLHRLDVR